MDQADRRAAGSSFNPMSYNVLYRGSVKDVRGPVKLMAGLGQPDGPSVLDGVVFDYTDAYSVFDWGRMPDTIPRKGSALALIAAEWFERIERAETWKEFSRSPDTVALRKGNRFGSLFNEIGEELQTQGIRTHYLGVLPEASGSAAEAPSPALVPWTLAATQRPVRHMVVRQVAVVKPSFQTILGRSIPNYLTTQLAPAPKLIPLEVVFRFGVPEGSSLLERVERIPGYLASIGFGDFKIEPGVRWDFPVLELFTKLEPSDRPLSLTEALAISGLSGDQMQRMLLKTAWVAGYLKSLCARRGIELADGKLEWAVSQDGGLFLVDAVGPDELRLVKDGIQLSKEFLRIHYRQTSWYRNVLRAKELAQKQGIAEWKKFVGDQPPPLSASFRDLASNLYMSLANELTGRNWFPEAWSLARVVEGIRQAQQVNSQGGSTQQPAPGASPERTPGGPA